MAMIDLTATIKHKISSVSFYDKERILSVSSIVVLSWKTMVPLQRVEINQKVRVCGMLGAFPEWETVPRDPTMKPCYFLIERIFLLAMERILKGVASLMGFNDRESCSIETRL